MNMDRRHELLYKRKAIPEALFFIQADLNNLSEDEEDRIHFVLNRILLTPINKRAMPQSDLALQRSQRGFSSRLDVKTMDLAKSIQLRLRRLFFRVMESKSTDPGDLFFRYRLPTVKLELWKNVQYGWTSIQPWAFGPQEREDEALVNFAFLLFDGGGVKSIRKCKGCGHYFANFTARGKLYCDVKCTWKSIARNRRNELKKHPRKYQEFLRQQSEYMWRRYEAKRRAELGKVKIKRRVQY